MENFKRWLSLQRVMLQEPDGRFVKTQERRVANTVRKAFKTQMDYIIKSLENRLNVNFIEDDILDEILRDLPAKEMLAIAVIEGGRRTLLKGGKRSVKPLDLKTVGIDFSLQHPDAVNYLTGKRRLLLSDYRGTITNTTNQGIKKIVSKGVSEGKSYSAIATEIRGQFDKGVFSRARAELIGSHEMKEAYNFGKTVPIDEFRAKYPNRRVEKEWITVSDERVTEECLENGDAGWIDYDEVFPSGDPYPPRFPGCRCSWSSKII